MWGLIDDSGFVGGSLPSDVEGVAIDNLISGSCRYGAGESVLAVLSNDGQFQCLVVNLLGLVDLVHPTRIATAMQTVVTSVVLVVLLQLDGVTIQYEATHVDAVSIAAYA